MTSKKRNSDSLETILLPKSWVDIERNHPESYQTSNRWTNRFSIYLFSFIVHLVVSKRGERKENDNDTFSVSCIILLCQEAANGVSRKVNKISINFEGRKKSKSKRNVRFYKEIEKISSVEFCPTT